MPVVLATLRTELLSSAQASAYSANIALGDDNAVADSLNVIGASTVSISIVTAAMLQHSVTSTEYVALTQVQRDLWNAILTAAVGGIAISNTAIRTQIGQVWSATTTTRGTLSNLQARTSSRCEILFGEGVSVTPNEVNKALHP